MTKLVCIAKKLLWLKEVPRSVAEEYASVRGGWLSDKSLETVKVGDLEAQPQTLYPAFYKKYTCISYK